MNPVIMKLGNERVHHYAHQPDVVCAATQPETALHLNTKFHIYKQLLSGTQLYLEQQCSKGCGGSRKVSWVEDWEKVEIEFGINPFRPDIAIVGKGGAINAIEVMATHHVEDDKEAFYKLHNIGWLEVDACESIYEGENTWRIDQPLPFSVCTPSLTEWTCDNCREQLRKDEELRLRERRLDEFRKHNYSETIAANMVDFYYPSGKKYREVYYLMKVIRNDKYVGVWIKNRGKELILRQDGAISEELLRELAINKIRSEVDRKCQSSGAIVDDRELTSWVPGKKFVAQDIERYPFIYVWDGGVRKWVKRERQKLVSWNTQPKEMHITPQDTIDITKQEGVCIFCGQTTTDWWTRDGATGKCKCYKCRDEGKY